MLTHRTIGVSVDLLAANLVSVATPLYQQAAAGTVDRTDLEHSYVLYEDAARKLESIRWLDHRPFGRTNGLADMPLRVLGNVGEQSAHSSRQTLAAHDARFDQHRWIERAHDRFGVPEDSV